MTKNYEDFSGEREVFPFRYEGQWYVIQEKDGGAIGKYKSKQARKNKMVNKTVVLGNIEDSEIELLAICVHEAEVEIVDDTAHVRKIGDLVSESTIRKWRASVQTKLFDRAAEMHGLTDDAKAEEKND